ncbi:Nn.00g116970.m01.CDS01 [Neocucurbitaria sp. VM-36]
MFDRLSGIHPGWYTAGKIEAVIKRSFSRKYFAIPDANNLAWETQDDDTATYFEQTIPIGYVKFHGTLWKVSAYMRRSTGEIQLYRHGMRSLRSKLSLVQLSSPFLHLRKEGKRRLMELLQVLCQKYFLEARHVMGLQVVGTEWFRSLELACTPVGEGMGMLEKPELGFGDGFGGENGMGYWTTS